ncbi:MAG: hypothetical protein AMS20_14155 [Gemmatimonas sp. SG8_28]|nr:MAG: hypothetical protein AMS20_14155 [Gemmatimonas sp. SG8_28]
MIDSSAAAFLRRFLPARASEHGARTVALGIVRDHVHLVLQVGPVFDLPRLVQGLKGASARLLNADIRVSPTGLRWAPGYNVQSVSPADLTRVVAYVRNQSTRHPDRAIEPARYLWG